jgi:hypothetical protein
MLFNITDDFLYALYEHAGVRITIEELKRADEMAKEIERRSTRERLVGAGQCDLFGDAA